MNFVINNIRALQVFQVLRQGAAVLISILLAKSSLSVEEIGVFEMLIFIGTTVSFFWIAGLNQGMLPFFPKLKNSDQAHFITNIFLLFSGISVFVFLLLFFLEEEITFTLVGKNSLPYFRIFAVYLLFFMPSFLVDYFYLLKNKPKRIVQFGLTVFSLQILAVVLPVFLGWGLMWSIYGLVGLSVLRFLWLVILVIQFGQFKLKINLLQPYLKLSIPLILYALLSGFPVVFDSWVVGWFFKDEKAFAIFRFGARELPLTIALAGALGTAMIPQIVNNQKIALHTLRKRSLHLYHVLFPISIILMWTSWWWFPKVFSSDFVESAPIFNVFLLIIISRLLFPQTILIALGKTKMVLYISILETIINVVLSIWLVQHYGLIGIAFGTFIAYFFEKIAIAFYLFSKHQISFQQYTPVSWFLAYSILLVVAFIFS